jgi:hypothetical protein
LHRIGDVGPVLSCRIGDDQNRDGADQHLPEAQCPRPEREIRALVDDGRACPTQGSRDADDFTRERAATGQCIRARADGEGNADHAENETDEPSPVQRLAQKQTAKDRHPNRIGEEQDRDAEMDRIAKNSSPMTAAVRTRPMMTTRAHSGITVNSVAPALIETDMIAGNPAATPDLIPIGRLGQTQEVADVVMLAVSNGYLTGQTLSVNGGAYMT